MKHTRRMFTGSLSLTPPVVLFLRIPSQHRVAFIFEVYSNGGNLNGYLVILPSNHLTTNEIATKNRT